jgi:hypothetical protein
MFSSSNSSMTALCVFLVFLVFFCILIFVFVGMFLSGARFSYSLYSGVSLTYLTNTLSSRSSCLYFEKIYSLNSGVNSFLGKSCSTNW